MVANPKHFFTARTCNNLNKNNYTYSRVANWSMLEFLKTTDLFSTTLKTDDRYSPASWLNDYFVFLNWSTRVRLILVVLVVVVWLHGAVTTTCDKGSRACKCVAGCVHTHAAIILCWVVRSCGIFFFRRTEINVHVCVCYCSEALLTYTHMNIC